MSNPLLITKLKIPPLRPNFVRRPRLVERLNQGLQLGHVLTLVSAPAGFGKTTLVREWVDELEPDLGADEEERNSIAWLSLDERDGELARFLAYLVAALNQATATETAVGTGALAMLKSPQPPPVEEVLISLINDIAALPGRMILVLDDYHLIDSPADSSSRVDEAIAFLLEHQPPQLHLVIATRVDPRLPLARHRARGQLTEIRAAELRFTAAEANQFFSSIMGLALSSDEVLTLAERTEGWISGLQLAALALKGAVSLRLGTGTADFIASFSGSHHFVLDYLLEEVLEQQTETIQTFLLQTAVLERLNGGLCDAVCFDAAELPGRSNERTATGQETLEALEHANLFVVPLDEERRWYRYHHLFSDLLRRRLRQKHPEWVPGLHARAGEWYRRNGFVDEAVEHTLLAGEVDRAAGMIEENADALWRQGERLKLHRWLAALPLDLVLSRPQLAVFHAWDKFAAGQQDAAERSLEAVEQALESDISETVTPLQIQVSIPSALIRKNLRGKVSAIRALLASHRGELDAVIEHARRALDDLPAEALSWRSAAAMALGDAYALRGNYPAAGPARSEAMETSKAAGNSYLYLIVSLKHAVNLRAQGRLQQTIDICQDRFAFANEHGMARTDIVGWLLTIWGEALAETNALAEALELVRKGVALTEAGDDVAMLGWSYLCQTRVLYSRGEFAQAAETIGKMADVAREHTVPPWIMKPLAVWQIRLWLAQDRLEDAVEWVRERGLDSKTPPTDVDALERLALARILIHQGITDEATVILEPLLKPAEAGGHVTRVIELLLLQSLALQAQGRVLEALVTLEQAISRAEQSGYVRIFVDEGPEMADLLYQSATRGGAPAYARRLLAAFPVTRPESADSRERPADSPVLVEPLSERETEVLQLISEGLTNRQIAERLYLSLNTVKAHSRNIYGKLDVHNRVQAVARARELTILPPI